VRGTATSLEEWQITRSVAVEQPLELAQAPGAALRHEPLSNLGGPVVTPVVDVRRRGVEQSETTAMTYELGPWLRVREPHWSHSKGREEPLGHKTDRRRPYVMACQAEDGVENLYDHLSALRRVVMFCCVNPLKNGSTTGMAQVRR
jgi:hypothetical protein